MNTINPTIQQKLDEFRKKFIVIGFSGYPKLTIDNGEIIVQFLLDALTQTERETAEKILTDIENQATMFTRHVEISHPLWTILKRKYLSDLKGEHE